MLLSFELRRRFVLGARKSAASRHENGSALQASVAQIGERLIGGGERIARRLRLDAGLRRDGEEIHPITPREIGNRDDLALFP